jgi:drug/metabolite transporter (DMT)-like permease
MKKIFIIIFLTFTTSFTPIAAKFIVYEINPIILAFFRFGTATVLLLIVFYFKKLDFKIERKDRLKFFFLGVLVIPVNQVCFLYGINLSTASHSGIIYSCTPLIAYFLAILIKNETFNLKRFGFIFLSILGIIVIFYDSLLKTESNNRFFWGDILLFFAVASWASYITLVKDMVIKYGVVKASSISFSTGMILFIPVFLLNLDSLVRTNISPLGYLAFFHLAVIVAFGGYFVFSYSTKIISVSSLATLTNASPIFTIFFSWFLLGESISYYFIIGAIITLTGVIFTQRIRENIIILE